MENVLKDESFGIGWCKMIELSKVLYFQVNLIVRKAVKKRKKTYGIFHTCPDHSQPDRAMEKKQINFVIADS